MWFDIVRNINVEHCPLNAPVPTRSDRRGNSRRYKLRFVAGNVAGLCGSRAGRPGEVGDDPD